MTDKAISYGQLFEQKTNALHLTIANIQREGKDHGFDDTVIARMCQPYLSMLRSMYEEELPLIKLIGMSDLALWLQGPAFDTESPRVSLITSVFTRVRTQVANVAKSIAHLSDSERMIPREIDLGLTALAHGSLVLGFSLPEANGLQHSEKGQQNLLGKQDPLYVAAREAIRTIGIVTETLSAIPTEDSINGVYKTVSDPAVRDATLNAVAKLSPTNRGVDKVSLTGKGGDFFRHVLTKETKKRLKPVLLAPVRSQEQGVITGEIREIDLDMKRFVIRNIENENIQQLRCSFNFPKDEHARELLARRVTVAGKIERDKQGRARLMAVEKVEELDRS
ncbi:MAG: hypothetical protein SF097_14620 [Acidobacteriota bacterium]|nr:hypothetical protein [Acidobacteriota bacterium]